MGAVGGAWGIWGYKVRWNMKEGGALEYLQTSQVGFLHFYFYRVKAIAGDISTRFSVLRPACNPQAGHSQE